MKFLLIRRNISILFLFIFGFAGAEELLRVDQPVSGEERRLLKENGYRIAGNQTLCLDYQDGSLCITSRTPLYDQNGKECCACQKLILPLKSLRFPIICEKEGEKASICYGPYSFAISQINDEILSKLKEAVKGDARQESSYMRPSQAAKRLGCSYLAHSTRPENLVAILNSGELNPSKGKNGRLRGDLSGNDQFVFCSLVLGDPELDSLLFLSGNGLPILVFNAEPILDCYHWHANAGHPLGAFSQIKTTDGKLYYSAHHSDPARFTKLLSRDQTRKRNEIVFHNPLQLDALKMILVKKGMKKQLLDMLPDDRYKERIVEVDPLFEDSFRFPEWLKPYSLNSHDKVRLGLENSDLDLAEFKALVRNEYPQLIKLAESNQLRKTSSKVQWLQQLLELYN